jgi:hypothetical protein
VTTLAEIRQQVEEAQQKLRHEGQQIGERKGVRQVLLRMLRGRFGELPPATVARIEAAELEVLEAWADQVFTAQSLDEVFGGS